YYWFRHTVVHSFPTRRSSDLEGESPEFLHAQDAARVVAHDAIDDGHHAEALDAFPQQADGFPPRAYLGGPAVGKAGDAAHLAANGPRIVRKAGAADECERFGADVEIGRAHV